MRSGPDTIAECGAGVHSRRKAISSTGSEAGLGVLLSCLRQRGQSAKVAVTEDYLHRCCTCTSIKLTSRDDYSLCREEDFNGGE